MTVTVELEENDVTVRLQHLVHPRRVVLEAPVAERVMLKDDDLKTTDVRAKQSMNRDQDTKMTWI